MSRSPPRAGGCRRCAGAACSELAPAERSPALFALTAGRSARGRAARPRARAGRREQRRPPDRVRAGGGVARALLPGQARDRRARAAQRREGLRASAGKRAAAGRYAGSTGLHRPDLVLLRRPRRRLALPVAVEVELTVKAPQRLRAICRAWARCSQVAGVVYLVSRAVAAGGRERASRRRAPRSGSRSCAWTRWPSTSREDVLENRLTRSLALLSWAR